MVTYIVMLSMVTSCTGNYAAACELRLAEEIVNPQPLQSILSFRVNPVRNVDVRRGLMQTQQVSEVLIIVVRVDIECLYVQ